jgi:hypothetical protein
MSKEKERLLDIQKKLKEKNVQQEKTTHQEKSKEILDLEERVKQLELEKSQAEKLYKERISEEKKKEIKEWVPDITNKEKNLAV